MTQDLQTRFADARPGTFDAESRTVEVVAATQTPVPRRDMSGPFSEVLEVSDRAVDLGQIEGAPVLDSHNRFELGAVIGRVEGARIEAGELRARVRFSGRDEVAGIVQDVRDGILSRVSVGYTVQDMRDEKAADGGRAKRATRWTPREVSLVAIPADSNAKVRKHEMADDNTAPAAGQETGPVGTAPAAPSAGQRIGGGTQAAPAQAAPAAAAGQARATMADIRGIATAAGLGDAFIDRAVEGAMTPDQARAAAMTEIEGRASNGPINATGRVSLAHDHDDPSNVRAAMSEALAAQYAGRAPEGRATEYARWDPLAMGADLASRRGGRIDARDRHGTVEALLGRAGQHVSSDFPALLEDAANKIFLDQYQAAAPTYRQWASRRSFTDFRPHRFLRAGDFPSLQPVAEGGALNYGTLSENRETVQAGEYARGLSIGRQMLVNGEFLSATGDFASMAATRTAADENAMAYGILANDGPTMADGKPLFHADHGNKAATPAAITVDSIGTAVAALRAQKSLDGIPLNLQPAFLVVGPENELAARKVLANVTPDSAANANPFAGVMSLIVDANVTGARWYVTTSPAAAPSVVFGYVAGNIGPQLQTEIDFDTRALKVRLSLDFATGAIDHRGVFLNEGA